MIKTLLQLITRFPANIIKHPGVSYFKLSAGNVQKVPEHWGCWRHEAVSDEIAEVHNQPTKNI